MKNFEKYKNQNDLINAFLKNRKPSSIAVAIVQEFVKWREMEAVEEKPFPCPLCGSRMGVHGALLRCTGCGLTFAFGLTTNDVTSAFNRVARAVKEAEKDEGAKNEIG